MEYYGYFKTVKDDTIKVSFYTESNTNTKKEITLGEEPCIITVSSPDGIFSPIKSRGCTIQIVTKEPYYDLYSGRVQGVSCEVTNITKGETLFSGYVTPCTYNQPYVYLDTLEIECVDALSTLEDIKVDFVQKGKECMTFLEIIRNFVFDKAHYSGKLYVSTKIPTCDRFTYAFENEYISVENFYDDDDEKTPWSCYEVLEEIGRIYGCTFVPYGNDVYVIDPKAISTYRSLEYWCYTKSGQTITKIEQSKQITKNDYCGDEQEISLDEVFNKISVKANIYEIESDKIIKQLEDAKKETLWTENEKWNSKKRGHVATAYIRKQNLTDGEWKNNYFYMNDNRQLEYWGGSAWSRGFSWQPIEAFWTDVTERYEKANWNNYFLLETQAKRFQDIGTYEYKPSNMSNLAVLWYNDFMPMFRPDEALLYYDSPSYVNYTPPTSATINYININCNLMYNTDEQVGDIVHHLYGDNGYYTPLPFSEIDNGGSRVLAQADAFDGFALLPCRLRIGDKWWDGSQWVRTRSIFWINFNQGKKMEDNKICANAWLQPALNYDYTSNINEMGWSIPISAQDKVTGKLHFEVLYPQIPWLNQLKIVGGGGYVQGHYISNGRVQYQASGNFPTVHLKDLKLQLISASTQNWQYATDGDDKDDDDIVYTNIIDDSIVNEMDDIEVKINSYSSNKPLAHSYILTYQGLDLCYNTKGFVNKYTSDFELLEEQIIQKYYEHYSTPKFIYDATVHGYYAPYLSVTTTAIQGVTFVVDEQEYNVLEDQNTIKLIEY